MSRHFFFYCLLLCFSIYLVSCASGRNATAARIGLVPLTDYSLAGSSQVTDTTYRVFTNEADFAASFSAASGSAKRPGFDGQTAVAILLREPSSLQFEKAEVVGNTINVYVQSCTTGNGTGCKNSNVHLATIPRVGSAKRVAFIINGNTRRTIGL